MDFQHLLYDDDDIGDMHELSFEDLREKLCFDDLYANNNTKQIF